MSAISKVVYGNRLLIDLTADTVEASKLLKDYTAHGADGELITGTCEYDADTSDADAVAGNILTGKTAYVNGNKVTGVMPNNGAISEVIDEVDDVITVPAGYHDGSGTVSIDSTEQAKIIADNIKDGVQILGVTGTYTGEGVPTEQCDVTPYTTAQTILPSAGHNISQVNVAAIAYSETQNSGGGLTATIGTVAPVTP